MYQRSSESDSLQYKSRGLKKTICSNSEGWWWLAGEAGRVPGGLTLSTDIQCLRVVRVRRERGDCGLERRENGKILLELKLYERLVHPPHLPRVKECLGRLSLSLSLSLSPSLSNALCTPGCSVGWFRVVPGANAAVLATFGN